jgi:hypothetical protein
MSIVGNDNLNDGHPPQTATRDANASMVNSVLGLITSVVGYTAVLSALLLYFGYIRTRQLYLFFGVDLGALRLTTSDYIIRSADVLFQPLILLTLALAALCALGYVVKVTELKAPRKVRYAVRCVLALVTVASATYALLGLFRVGDRKVAAAALGLTAALILMQHQAYAKDPKAKSSEFVLAIATFLIGASAFWWTHNYAEEQGRKAAHAFAFGNEAPGIVIYSKNDLVLEGRREIYPGAMPAPDGSPWRFKFDGYKVLIFANDRWFLFRRPWPEHSYTVMLPANDDSILVRFLGDNASDGH